jgi:hypothetical protein
MRVCGGVVKFGNTLVCKTIIESSNLSTTLIKIKIVEKDCEISVFFEYIESVKLWQLKRRM